MKNLQYDSFYKFIVSVGAILTIAPIIALHYLISGSYDIILSIQEYDALSETSLQLISNKERWLNILFNAIPYIFIMLIIIGLFFVLWGGGKWYSIQKKLDKGVDLDIQEKEFKYKSMTSTEIAEKAIVENLMDQKDSDTPISNNPSHTEAYQTPDYHAQKVSKGFEVEKAYFKYISKKLNKKYVVHQNIKVGDAGFDIIATSKFDNIDYLYEIKYWPSLLAKPVMTRLFKQIEKAGELYENTAHRNFRFKIVIVTTSENFSALKKHVTDFFNAEHYSFIDLEFLSEDILLK